MEEIGEDTQKDVMRAFFCSWVADVGKLLGKVSDIVTAVSKAPTGNVSPLLPEANDAILVSPYCRNISQSSTYSYGSDGPKIIIQISSL